MFGKKSKSVKKSTVRKTASKRKLKKKTNASPRKSPRATGKVQSDRRNPPIVLDGSTRAGKIKWETRVVTVDGKQYHIPVDEHGNVPEGAIVSRFAAVEEGDRAGRKRSVSKDLNKTATETLALGTNIKPEDIAKWWANPNELDIVGIDDETSEIFDTAGATRKSSLEYQRKIGIVGTPQERAMVRRTLDECFTAAELKKMTEGGAVYIFAHDDRWGLTPNQNGYYSPSSERIVLRKGVGPGTVVHESVHKLRHNDQSRKGVFTTSKVDELGRAISTGKRRAEGFIRAVEEAGTDAETIARLSPYKSQGNRVGYYGYFGIEAKKMMDDDRKLLTGSNDPDKKGLKGRKAVSSVERNFIKTNISNYGYGGKKARDYRKN